MYSPKYWKHGINITVQQFREYLMDNIPLDAIMCDCGDRQIFMHLEEDGSVFSIDHDSLSDLPEYEKYAVDELCCDVR